MKKRLCVLVAQAPIGALIAVLGSASPGNAWVSLACKFHHSRVTYVITSGYPVRSQNAVDAWNNAGADAELVEGGGLDNADVAIIKANYGSVGYDGITFQVCSGGYVSGSGGKTAAYNTYYTNTYGNTARKQIMVHELGHVFGLGHAGSAACSGQPIMYFSSDRWFTCGNHWPLLDDIAGVNALY